MINWIVGGIIIGFVLYVVIRSVRRMRKGESSCCSGCSQCGSDCEGKKL